MTALKLSGRGGERERERERGKKRENRRNRFRLKRIGKAEVTFASGAKRVRAESNSDKLKVKCA